MTAFSIRQISPRIEVRLGAPSPRHFSINLKKTGEWGDIGIGSELNVDDPLRIIRVNYESMNLTIVVTDQELVQKITDLPTDCWLHFTLNQMFIAASQSASTRLLVESMIDWAYAKGKEVGNQERINKLKEALAL